MGFHRCINERQKFVIYHHYFIDCQNRTRDEFLVGRKNPNLGIEQIQYKQQFQDKKNQKPSIKPGNCMEKDRYYMLTVIFSNNCSKSLTFLAMMIWMSSVSVLLLCSFFRILKL